jgi:hypothetical protein
MVKLRASGRDSVSLCGYGLYEQPILLAESYFNLEEWIEARENTEVLY